MKNSLGFDLKDCTNLIGLLLTSAMLCIAGCGYDTPIPPNTSPEVSALQKPEKCIPLGPGMKLGPALTVAEREEKSLVEVKVNPSVPQIPFGAINAEWESLKNKIQPNDKLYQFEEDDLTGGTILVRGDCVIGTIEEWIR